MLSPLLQTLNPDHNESCVLARTTDFGTRLSIVDMKKRVLEKDVLDDLIIIAKTGCRRVFDEDDEGTRVESYQLVPAKEHIAVLKLLIDKVLPNCKEQEQVEGDYAKWLEHATVESDPVQDLTPEQRERARLDAKARAIAGAKEDGDGTTSE